MPLDKERIYRFTDGCDNTANFAPANAASLIFSLRKDEAESFCKGDIIIQNEFGLGSPQSKNQRALTGEMIKEICIPISINRIGEITLR